MIFFACGLLSFILCFFFTQLWISISKRRSIVQAIREEGPKEHLTKKKSIPTMGGIAILLSVVLSTILFGDVRLWILLGTFLACGLLGLTDDWLKTTRGKNLGLLARHKLMGQFAIGALLWFFLQKYQAMPLIQIPFWGTWDPGRWSLPLVIFLLTATSNAVNLTDGLDGLAAGITLILAIFFLCASWFLQPWSSDAYFSAALVGATAAFLWFNAHPAKVFMGDVGSLALGGALCALVLQTGLMFWLPIAGGALVAETLSVIIQVVYFKATQGRRIFKMSPLHHHFELSGVPETQVTTRFWLVTFFLTWFSLLGVFHGK